MENEIMSLKLDDIIPNRFQPREVFDEESLEKLADSIKQHGVIEPIIVRPVGNKFEIVAGERRYKASVLAGLTKIPAIVRQMDDKESSIVAYIENEHRNGVSAIEEARTIERILKSNDMTQEELAKELGINQSTIANKLRLLNLPMEIQDALMHNEISERHARSLLSVKEEEKQIELLNKIKERRMTVRELDGEIKNMYNSGNELNNYESNITNNNQVLNNVNAPSVNPEPVVATESSFMNFLKNYDSNNPLPGSPEEKQEFLTPAGQDKEFIQFVNDYEHGKVQLPEESQQEVALAQNNEFLNFMNDFDKNYTIPSEITPTPSNISKNESVTSPNNEFLNFMDNFDKNYIIPSTVQEPVNPVNEPVQEKPSFNDDDFMNFLNNNDNNSVKEEPITPPVQEEVIPQEPQTTDDFMNFWTSMKKEQDNNSATPVNEQVVPNEAPAIHTEPVNNVQLNDINPPITNTYNPNQYIEDNPNYVDITKNITVDNVDEIIDRIKNVVDDIKATSTLKIDTDEINFDDIYQITIKIDKRNF